MIYGSRISNSKELQRPFLPQIGLLFCRIFSPAKVSDVPAVNSARPIALVSPYGCDINKIHRTYFPVTNTVDILSYFMI